MVIWFFLISICLVDRVTVNHFIHSIFLNFYFVHLKKCVLQRVAVLHLEEKCERAIEWASKIEPSIKHLVCEMHSFVDCYCLKSSMDMVLHKTKFYLCQVVSGGVASNQYVRARLNQIVEKNCLQLVCPPPKLCTDNGEMVLFHVCHVVCNEVAETSPLWVMAKSQWYWCDIRFSLRSKVIYKIQNLKMGQSTAQRRWVGYLVPAKALFNKWKFQHFTVIGCLASAYWHEIWIGTNLLHHTFNGFCNWTPVLHIIADYSLAVVDNDLGSVWTPLCGTKQ